MLIHSHGHFLLPMMHPDWHMLVCHQLPADQVHTCKFSPIDKKWMRSIIQHLMTMAKLLVPLCIIEDAINMWSVSHRNRDLRLKTMAKVKMDVVLTRCYRLLVYMDRRLDF